MNFTLDTRDPSSTKKPQTTKQPTKNSNNNKKRTFENYTYLQDNNKVFGGALNATHEKGLGEKQNEKHICGDVMDQIHCGRCSSTNVSWAVFLYSSSVFIPRSSNAIRHAALMQGKYIFSNMQHYSLQSLSKYAVRFWKLFLEQVNLLNGWNTFHFFSYTNCLSCGFALMITCIRY